MPTVRYHIETPEGLIELLEQCTSCASGDRDKWAEQKLSEFFAKDPVLRRFRPRKELRIELGHEYPVQIHIDNPEVLVTPWTVLRADSRLVGTNRVARIEVSAFFSLPQGETRKLGRYALNGATAMLAWENTNGGRYRLLLNSSVEDIGLHVEKGVISSLAIDIWLGKGKATYLDAPEEGQTGE
ncbi:MAG: hypothetical protein ABIA47_03535 [bacterium]